MIPGCYGYPRRWFDKAAADRTPEPVICSDMEQCLALLERAIEGSPVRQVACHDLERQMLDVAPVRTLAGERPNLPTFPDERSRNSRADEPGSSRHQSLHDSRESVETENAHGASEPVRAIAARDRLAAR
jgi:hypothetical protein